MRVTEWRNTVIIISVGLLFLIASLLFTVTGNGELLSGFNSIFTPLVALFLGVLGLQIYGKDSNTRDDKFYTMNLWFAIGLIMLSLAEIAKSLISLSMNPTEMMLIVSLVQLPGLLLWGIAIIQYLRTLNSVLGYVHTNNLWIGLFLISTLSTLVLIVVNTIQFQMIGFVENIVLSPIIVGLAILSGITAILVWIFRKGSLSKPLFLILAALVLYLVRCSLWLFTDAGFEAPTDDLVAIEAFILCGAALVLARNL
jgi:hypothetical protein